MASSSRSGSLARRAAAVAAVCGCATAAGAQSAASPDHVRGRVVRPGGDSVVGVPGTMVTLHRVAPDRAGPLDSMRTDAAGRFAFTYRRSGSDEAIYFVSSSYGGVAYFTPPLAAGDVSGDNGIITVFDTTSRAVPVTVRGRHVIMQTPDADGRRIVTEVYELSNDSSVTLVANGTAPKDAVWSAGVPTEATAAAVGEGDVPAQAVTFRAGRVMMFAPLPPGIRQLAFHYALPSSAFPLKLPLEHPTAVLEVLVQERDAAVSGAHLREVAAAAVSGREFRRFVGQDVPPSAVITIQAREIERPRTLWFAAGLTIVIGGIMTLVLARALRRR